LIMKAGLQEKTHYGLFSVALAGSVVGTSTYICIP
jgi:hypothetical protein